MGLGTGHLCSQRLCLALKFWKIPQSFLFHTISGPQHWMKEYSKAIRLKFDVRHSKTCEETQDGTFMLLAMSFPG